MTENQSNLEKYYYHKGTQAKPFEHLTKEERKALWDEDGYLKYLNMKVWTCYIGFAAIAVFIIVTAYFINN